MHTGENEESIENRKTGNKNCPLLLHSKGNHKQNEKTMEQRKTGRRYLQMMQPRRA